MQGSELVALAQRARRAGSRLWTGTLRGLRFLERHVRPWLLRLDAWIDARVLPPPGGKAPKAPGTPRRNGGSFSARPSRPPQLLAPSPATLDEDQIEAMQHDSLRRKEEARALAIVQQHRGAFGAFKLERLASLPRTFAPASLEPLLAAHPELAGESIEALATLLAPLSRGVCDRAAAKREWDAQRGSLIGAVAPRDRERAAATLERLGELALPLRRAILRLPRAPVASHLEALIPSWPALAPDDVRAVAHAIAQFSGQELLRALNQPVVPVKIAPKGLRG